MFLGKPVKKPEGNLEEHAVLSLSSISLGISEWACLNPHWANGKMDFSNKKWVMQPEETLDSTLPIRPITSDMGGFQSPYPSRWRLETSPAAGIGRAGIHSSIATAVHGARCL